MRWQIRDCCVRLGRVGAALLATALLLVPASGDEPVKEGGWLRQKDDKTGVTIQTMEMTLYPADEPRPALGHQLVPDDFDLIEGNAAIYYLKAMGFLEQDAARDRLRRMHEEAGVRAQKEKKSWSDVPPGLWLAMPPSELPKAELKSYLELTSFQPALLQEAARRHQFDLDRNLRGTNDPFGYLLPELQAMREIARTQNLRCKLAIAENRIADAMAVLGQQYAMVRHIAQDEFLISHLVAIACAGITWDDALYLVQHREAPNLYWAFASLPRPLVDIRRSLAVERQLLYLQFKALGEVSETPRPAGYWQDFLDRLVPQFGSIAGEFGLSAGGDDRQTARAMLVGFVAAAYPGAKRYLVNDCGLAREQVEAYPTAQVVFLALVRYYDEARDDCFKWSKLPYWQADAKTRVLGFEGMLHVKPDRVGWSAMPVQMLLPAVLTAQSRAARADQQLALVQTVEAIRLHGATHGGRLPVSLDELALPVPLDPATGKPFAYRLSGDHAVLSGRETPDIRYQLVLRFAGGAK